MAPQRPPTAWLRLAALLAALAAHAAVLVAFVRESPDPMAGSGGLLPGAVNVTMVNAAVFEAREDVRAPPAPATADAVEAVEGAPESKAAFRQRKEEKTAPDEPIPPAAIAAREPPKASEPPQAQQKESNEASATGPATGGAAVRGDALSLPKQRAPAAASPGTVREYERLLAQALARAKPKTARVTGERRTVTVIVELRISPAGELASVDITKSSGSKRLDEIAVAAVQRAKLPLPPMGMTSEQLFYTVPFEFDFR